MRALEAKVRLIDLPALHDAVLSGRAYKPESWRMTPPPSKKSVSLDRKLGNAIGNAALRCGNLVVDARQARRALWGLSKAAEAKLLGQGLVSSRHARRELILDDMAAMMGKGKLSSSSAAAVLAQLSPDDFQFAAQAYLSAGGKQREAVLEAFARRIDAQPSREAEAVGLLLTLPMGARRDIAESRPDRYELPGGSLGNVAVGLARSLQHLA